MELSIEAMYEGGVLKPAVPFPLAEHERVRVVIHPATSRARHTAGLLQWTGDTETLRRLAEDPEIGTEAAR